MILADCTDYIVYIYTIYIFPNDAPPPREMRRWYTRTHHLISARVPKIL